MAKKITIFCITAFFLLLTLSHTVARPFHDVTPMETRSEDIEVLQNVDMEQDMCRGLGEDECMMRRTLDAHIDYIYTQKHNKP